MGVETMRKDVRRRHNAQIRVSEVCTAHSAVFDATPGGQNARTALAADVTHVDGLLAAQEETFSERRAASEDCRTARRALRGALKAVVSVGKLVNVDGA